MLNNQEAEKLVIGSILQWGDEAFYRVSNILSESDFFYPENRIIYSAIDKFFQNSKVSTINSTEILSIINNTDKRINKLLDDLNKQKYTLENLYNAAQIVAKLSLARSLKERLNQAADDIEEITGQEKLTEIIYKAEQPIVEFNHALLSTSEILNLGSSALDYIDYLVEEKPSMQGIPSGYPRFDLAIGGGLRVGVHLIGARAKCISIDKSFLLTNKGILSPQELHNGKENISKRLKETDYLISNGNGKLSQNYITRTRKKVVRKITTIHGHNLYISNNHKLLTSEGWKQANKIDSGDYLLFKINSQIWGNNEIPLDDAYNIGVNVAKNKLDEIPQKVRRCSRRIICSFLKGYYDTVKIENCNKDSIIIPVVNDKLRTQIVAILLNLGIITFSKEYEISIHNILYQKIFKYYISLLNDELYPYHNDNYNTLHDQVISNTIEDKQEVMCDYHVPDTNSFILNGCISHNSGKSFHAVSCCNNISALDIPVLYLDTELTSQTIMSRWIAMLSECSIDHIEDGSFADNPEELQKIKSVEKEIKKRPFYYYNISGRHHHEWLSVMRRWITKEVGIGKECVIILDYLKMMNLHDSGKFAEHQYLGQIITDLHNFCLEYEVPMISYTQLNRDGIYRSEQDVIAGSDKLIGLCSSFSIIRKKSEEDFASDPEINGNRKIEIVACRYGKGLLDGEYINLITDLNISKIEEGNTNIENRLNNKSASSLIKEFGNDIDL